MEEKILICESDYEQVLRVCEIVGKLVFGVGYRQLITGKNVKENLINHQGNLR